MISHFIVAHCTFMINISSKLKSQFQVIFDVKIPFLWKWVHFRSAFYRTLPTGSWIVEYLLLPLLYFYNILLVSNILFHMHACRWLLLNTSSMTSYLIFDRFFLHLHVDSNWLINTSNGTLCKYLTKIL